MQKHDNKEKAKVFSRKSFKTNKRFENYYKSLKKVLNDGPSVGLK
jgi:hypothetical protein